MILSTELWYMPKKCHFHRKLKLFALILLTIAFIRLNELPSNFEIVSRQYIHFPSFKFMKDQTIEILEE